MPALKMLPGARAAALERDAVLERPVDFAADGAAAVGAGAGGMVDRWRTER